MPKRQGFTLMEVLVSLAIMSVALLALTAVLTTGMHRDAASARRVAAYDVAEQSMTRCLQELDYGSVGVEDFWHGDFSDPGTPWRSGEVTVGRVVYRYKITAKNVQNRKTGKTFGEASGSPYNTLKKIDVSVDWDGSIQPVYLSRLLNREHR